MQADLDLNPQPVGPIDACAAGAAIQQFQFNQDTARAQKYLLLKK